MKPLDGDGSGFAQSSETPSGYFVPLTKHGLMMTLYGFIFIGGVFISSFF